MATRTWLVGLVAVLGSVAAAEASPIYDPLPWVNSPAQVNNTIVANGGFESPDVNETGGYAVYPDGWDRTGNMFIVPTSSIGTLVTNVDSSAQIAEGDTNGDSVGYYYQYTSLVTMGDSYVLSLDLWNFSGVVGLAPNNTADAYAQVLDNPDHNVLTQLTISPTDPGGANGYFAYDEFTATTSTVVVEVGFFSAAGAGGDDLIGAWDNVAVTPLADFVPPGIPEPASASILLAGGLALLGVRRRRV